MQRFSEKWSAPVVQSTDSHLPPRVVVIGAGMSGLVAARLLHDAGCVVTVLEARQRLGGRIWTDDRLGVPTDLGASWIHGADHNPLTDWCETLGIELAVTSDETRFLFVGGAQHAEQAILERAWRGQLLAKRAINRMTARLQQRLVTGQDANLTLAHALEPLLKNRRLRPLDKRVLAWRIATAEGVQGAPAHLLDLRDWFPKETEMVNALPLGGYKQLIDDVARGVTVQQNSVVTEIAYGSDEVRIQTEQEVHNADFVIITVPLSILQQKLIRFDPPLPPQKQAAIERIGFGDGAVLNKLLIRFPEAFWPPSGNRFLSLLEDSQLKNHQHRGLFTTWINLERFTGVPLLMTFTNGRIGAVLDETGDEQAILQVGLDILGRMFGVMPPGPVGYIFTRWLSDPWARGSYSYPKVGYDLNDRLQYAEPVAGRLYFAGEATDLKQYGTVHAALLSGQAAAKRLWFEHIDANHVPFTPPWRSEFW